MKIFILIIIIILAFLIGGPILALIAALIICLIIFLGNSASKNNSNNKSNISEEEFATNFFLAEAQTRRGWEAAQKGDYTTALNAWHPVAEQGHPPAQFNLGMMYYKGTGVSQDINQAVKWLGRAAKQGQPEAQFNLEEMYGDDFSNDEVESAKWYTLFAEAGVANAQNQLGHAYSAGAGVPEDNVIASKWFNIVLLNYSNNPLEAGEPKYILGDMNNEKTPKQARLDAIREGYTDMMDAHEAEQMISILSDKMTPRQIKQAEKLAKQWIANYKK